MSAPDNQDEHCTQCGEYSLDIQMWREDVDYIHYCCNICGNQWEREDHISLTEVEA